MVAGTVDASGLHPDAPAGTPGLTYNVFLLTAQSVLGSNFRDDIGGSPFADTINGGASSDHHGYWLRPGGPLRRQRRGGDLRAQAAVILDMTVGTGAFDKGDVITVSTTTANYAVTFASGYALQASGMTGAWLLRQSRKAHAFEHHFNIRGPRPKRP